jgi:hypothetical protein
MMARTVVVLPMPLRPISDTGLAERRGELHAEQHPPAAGIAGREAGDDEAFGGRAHAACSAGASSRLSPR